MSHAWLFTGTQEGRGRRRVIHPANTGLEYLRYGRIVLGPAGGEERFASGEEELGLVCLGGEGSVEAGGERYRLGRYDALYIPRETACRVQAAGAFDLAECAAPVSKRYPVQHVRFQTVLATPGLVTQAGFAPYARTIHTLIGETNVAAGRLLAGVTFSQDGNWTSWPPHDHHREKEEIYLYVDMPAPGFSLHLNYTEAQQMELVTPVREGDAVAIKRGYHYNVATPGTSTRFLWMMAAVREETDRVFTTVTVQPEFDGRFKLF
jgi:5-deoxy-glucuronate isomerase